MPRPRTKPSSKQTDAKRERDNRRIRAVSEDAREVGPLPKVKNWHRRTRCERSLLLFLETYFPNTFALAWSDDHRAAVADVERVIREGGLFALAMPRASGKSSIAVRAALWAILYGLRRFVVVIAAEAGKAKEMIEVLKTELQGNPLLLDDFPEVCHLMHALEGQTKRQQGQTCDQVPTRMKLGTNKIIFPTVTKASTSNAKQLVASGAVVQSVGITGSLRGMIAITADGTTFRPDLVLVDDAQTRTSAKSPTQTNYRERLVNGDVLGLAGPTRKIACMNLCTVIYPNDLSDRLLDKERNPAWNGRRTRHLIQLPADMDWWEKYAEVRRQSQRQHGDNRDGTALYAAEREAADRGAVAGWPARFDPDELSAVQNAMNIRIDRPEEFAAEYQNEPLVAELGAVNDLTIAGLVRKLNRVKAGTVPRECNRLTAFIDVGRILWWCVCGWDERFGGSVIEYDTWPRQNRTYFTNADARQTVAEAHPDLSEESAVYKALGELTERLAGKEWEQAETGTAMRLDRVLIDSAWLTNTVYRFCRRSAHASLLLPSRGWYVGPNGAPIDAWPAKDHERRGPSWRLSPPAGGSGRLLTFDPNFWKTFVAERLLTPAETPGCLWVNGTEAHEHPMLFEHLTCEYRSRVTVEERGRVYDAWSKRPGRSDNHLFDAVVGCAVAASERGLKWNADPWPIGDKPRKGKKARPKGVPAPHERQQIIPKRL